MTSSLSISASGLRASVVRLTASASNVANARSTGRPEADPPEQGRGAYRPVDTVQRDTVGGGTVAGVRARVPAFLPEYDPSSPDANEAGMVSAPNVDFAREAVSQIEASWSFNANLAAFRTSARMLDRLLDIKV
jgi:flagellar basal-body rod protein FlgC